MNSRILRAQRRIVGIVLCCANVFFAVCGNVISQELTPNLGNRPGYANLVYDAATGNVILSAAETQSQEFFSFALTRRDDAPAFELDAAVLPFAVTDRNTDLLPYQIGQFSDSDTDAAVSAFALGTVFPADMSIGEVSSYLVTAVYSSGRGQGGDLDLLMLDSLPAGDFTGDGKIGVHDVELLCGSLGDSKAALFDLTQDDLLDDDDLESHLRLAETFPGDLDFDGRVAFADFLTLAENFAQPGTYSDGDFTCDGVVNFADFITLSSNFGVSAAKVTAVPEPGAFGNCCGWLFVVLLVRRGRSILD